MVKLSGTRTLENLKFGFAGEAQANRRYLYFARQADLEGYSEMANIFRDTAEGETGHAFGIMEFIADIGDPVTNRPIGDTKKNLASALAGENHEFTDLYPGFARIARDEGFDEIAEWFEVLAKSEKSHAARFQKALEKI